MYDLYWQSQTTVDHKKYITIFSLVNTQAVYVAHTISNHNEKFRYTIDINLNSMKNVRFVSLPFENYSWLLLEKKLLIPSYFSWVHYQLRSFFIYLWCRTLNRTNTHENERKNTRENPHTWMWSVSASIHRKKYIQNKGKIIFFNDSNTVYHLQLIGGNKMFCSWKWTQK